MPEASSEAPLPDDAVDGGAALGAGLLGAHLAGARGLDGEPELLLERPGDGAADGVVLPPGDGGDLLDVAPSGRLSSWISFACLVPARGVGLAAGAAWAGLAFALALAFPLAGVGVPSASVAGVAASLAGGPASADVAGVGGRGGIWRVVLGLDAESIEAGAGDAQRRRVVATRGAPVIVQALGLEAVEHLVDGAALDLERVGQRQNRPVVALGRSAEDWLEPPEKTRSPPTPGR